MPARGRILGAASGEDADDGGDSDQLADTNFDMLPATRRKGPAVVALPEPKSMSKRKKRKLEQLAKKQEGKELREDVLSSLKKVQMTAEQAALMQASHSTQISKRDHVAMARRRIALGVPLSAEMKQLGKRPAPRRETEVVADCEQEDAASSSSSDAVRSSKIGRNPTSASASKAPTPKADTASVALPAPRAPPEAHDVVSPAAPPAELAPVVTPQPLKPVRIQRTPEIEEQRSRLPAVMCEQEVVESVLGSDVTLVCGETGCGKSTQVPQFIYEAGICAGDQYLIGVTQPRRVAAISVSQRVGQELNNPRTVGYQVRYDRSQCTSDMRIKFMTDGILLREVQADFLLRKYTAIVIDEAHERGVNCDILIGLLSRAVQRRRRDYEEAVAKGLYEAGGPDSSKPSTAPPLRLVIMSATLRLCDFTENKQLFPTPPPVMRIDARTFPVTAHFARSTEDDYIKAAQRSVLQIHRQLPPGAILVFVTGKQEVHRLCQLLNRNNRASRGASEAADEALDDQGDVAADDEDGQDLELLEASDDEEAAFDDQLDDKAHEGRGQVSAKFAVESTKKEKT